MLAVAVSEMLNQAIAIPVSPFFLTPVNNYFRSYVRPIFDRALTIA